MSEDNIDPNGVRELERARADLKALRSDYKTAQEDADRLRKERDGFKGQIEKQKSDFEARLSEATAAVEKARTESEAALSEVKTAGERAVLEAKAEALATRLGAHNPTDVVRLIDLSAVKRAEDGSFEGLADVLEAAKTERAYLFGEPPKTGAESGNTKAPPAPKPGATPQFNARTIDAADYEAQKRQFLAQSTLSPR